MVDQMVYQMAHQTAEWKDVSRVGRTVASMVAQMVGSTVAQMVVSMAVPRVASLVA
jgi:hypothetical protein